MENDQTFDASVSASAIWDLAVAEHRVATTAEKISRLCNRIMIDDLLSSVNIAIFLRDSGHLNDSQEFFIRIYEVYPNNPTVCYEYSLCLLLLDKHNNSLQYARQAALGDPYIIRFCLNYVRLLANLGNIVEAEHVLNRYRPASLEEAGKLSQMGQFVRYLKQYPRSMVEAKIQEISSLPCYSDDDSASHLIIQAVRNQSPFSFVRLGDGEGAWTFVDNIDESLYDSMYSLNRISFLEDWFGSSELLNSSDFFNYAQNLSKTIENADLIGIPDQSRISHEFRLISIRGVPSSVNTLRSLGLFDSLIIRPGQFTSNNFHMHLLDRKFYSQLFCENVQFGLITSHRLLPNLIREQTQANLVYEFLIPGDCRNFWIDDNNRPLVQFPDVVNSIMSNLNSLDLKGVVFLVAAGFVGKQYMDIIKRQGGIALDIGGVANHWAARSSVH